MCVCVFQNGQSCRNQEAYCYNGKCQHYDSQCQAIFGDSTYLCTTSSSLLSLITQQLTPPSCPSSSSSEAKAAPELCFKEVNSKGDRFGNCGYLNNGFKKCESR